MKGPRQARGFILLSVVLLLTTIAALTFLVGRDTGVNLRNAASAFQSDIARYATEAGLRQVNWTTQNKNCSGYADMPSTAFGANSFSATVNPKSGTPVTLVATGSGPNGATATMTRTNVVVHQTTPYTRNIQPGAALADTYINASYPTLNYGGDSQLYLQGNTINALLQFNLAVIPAGAKVQSVQLQLYKPNSGTPVTGETLSVYRLSRAWNEGTLVGGSPANGATWRTANGSANWTSQGGDYDTSYAVTIPYDKNQGWKTWDVTDMVKSWLSGTYPNNGMIVIPSAGIPNVSYNGGLAGGNTPVLAVTFLPPCGWIAPGSTLTLSASADNYIDSSNTSKNYGGSTSLKLNGGGGAQQRPLLLFDTSTIAPGTVVTSALLQLYVGSISGSKSTSRTSQAFNVTEAWVEGTLSGSGTADGATWNRKNATTNWATAGGSYSSTASGSVTLAGSFTSGWISIDITALVQNWVNGSTPNNGVILTHSLDETFNVNSKEAAANQPQLVIDVQ